MENANDVAIRAPFAPQLADPFAVSFAFEARRFLRDGFQQGKKGRVHDFQDPQHLAITVRLSVPFRFSQLRTLGRLSQFLNPFLQFSRDVFGLLVGGKSDRFSDRDLHMSRPGEAPIFLLQVE